MSVSHAPASRPRLRVVLVAGGLAQGGAERQLLYVARALRDMGAAVRVCSLTNEGVYQDRLVAEGFEPVWVGRFPGPPLRVLDLAFRLAPFRPHVIQACHSFVNLYAGLASRALGSLSLGALRSSLSFCRKANGAWTRWLMTVPDAIVTNSDRARDELCASGLVARDRAFVLPNALDVAAFARERAAPAGAAGAKGPVTAAFVGRIVGSKRLDVFLRALALARAGGEDLRGLVVGNGPALAPAQALAAELALGPEAVRFLGERDDVPCLLASADMLVLTSDDEGLPNVLLEGMAAGLPVVSTPAGETARIVEPGVNGVLVPFGDPAALAAALVPLARAPDLRRQFGAAGRELVRKRFDLPSLPERLRDLYRAAARVEGRRAILEALG